MSLVVPAAALGLVVGAGTRWLLVRLPRGAPVPVGWCEAGLAPCWAAVALAVQAGRLDPRWAALLAALSWLAVAGSATDLLVRRLPNALTVPALGLVLVALVPAGSVAVQRGLAGAVLLGGAYLVVHLVSPHAMGGGDVKLAAPVGAAAAGAGWALLPVVAVGAAVASAAVALVAVLAGRAAWGSRLPHGPVLLGVALAVVAVAVPGPRIPG
ncbi:prepilin peptidase [Pseudonocardia alni]|uniref:prepilin peptidase n=1 Tax=Pseudonocardia alni TaxID=33907 RepID=UPI003329C772